MEIPILSSYTNQFVEFVNGASNLKLFAFGAGLYLLVIAVASLTMYLSAQAGLEVIQHNGKPITDFPTIVHFNCITILTVGYGDFAPVGIGRFVAVTEALFGVAFLGVIIGVVVIRLTNASDNSIVFSRYCYYAKDEERFYVVFLNTNRRPLVHAEMSYVLKIGNWVVRPSIVSPYVGASVWTFFLGGLPIKDIPFLDIHTEEDGLKFSISGRYGLSGYSAYVKYYLREIVVVKSRDDIITLPELKMPEFGSLRLEESFHYKPNDSVNFLEFAEGLRSEIQNEG